MVSWSFVILRKLAPCGCFSSRFFFSFTEFEHGGSTSSIQNCISNVIWRNLIVLFTVL
jgi:hypothetical protein